MPVGEDHAYGGARAGICFSPIIEIIASDKKASNCFGGSDHFSMEIKIENAGTSTFPAFSILLV
ncbi:hypothetical protein HMPREF9103_01091 [Lentilactobacillus parafarraginis F0439]|uniref:Uncharacterized protein n=1 Tax=Lentilactobacillus parafarraginis F0439 TaxID=797515 RepID=G9ZMZ0_9LACO|nr:hypothetical protein HMPREF9103_01091 [Lentilactobacillus parafarraginis F0439]